MAKQELEIEKTLVVSTGHVTKRDMERLRAVSQDLYPSMYLLVLDGGPFVSVYLCGEDEALGSMSPAFRELFSWAKQHQEGFTYLKLDADGPVLEGFQTFEW
jgi:hypothetical protein